ncbi:MAG: V-type ATP synthase subunit E [Oscillospiraceae bacterium]|nr:V-type ATP synthase subunit E [Oscillospiraceae bacterium]
MAGADNLRNKILSDARATADTNITQARREAENIVLKAREEAQTLHGSLVARAERDASEREKRLISVAELEGRKDRLAVKQRLIESLFERAIQILCEKPDDEYEAMLVDMIAGAASGGEEVVLSGGDRARLSDGFIRAANAALAAKGKPGKLTLAGDAKPIKGGFVLRSGLVEVNNSFEAIVKMQKDNLESLAVKMLFN